MKSSIGFPSLLTLLFVTLKLCHQITWSWWLVLAPSWITLGLLAIVLLVVGALYLISQD